MSALAEIGGCFVVEEQRRQALDAERRPGPAGARIPISPHAGLNVQKSCDRAVIKELITTVFEAAFAECAAFGLEPQLVVIGADPSLSFPAIGVLARANAAFVLVLQCVNVDAVVHYRRH